MSNWGGQMNDAFREWLDEPRGIRLRKYQADWWIFLAREAGWRTFTVQNWTLFVKFRRAQLEIERRADR